MRVSWTKSRCWQVLVPVVAIVSTLACSQEAVTTDLPSTVVILAEDEADGVSDLCTRTPPSGISGYWEPTLQDVLRAESMLRSFAKAEAPPAVSSRLEEYKRQYIGVVLDGRRSLYVNAFLELGSPIASWTHSFVDFCDGGATAWGAVYDVEKQAFMQFEMNWELSSSWRRPLTTRVASPDPRARLARLDSLGRVGLRVFPGTSDSRQAEGKAAMEQMESRIL